MRSYMLARGGDAVVLLREEHATIAMNIKKYMNSILTDFAKKIVSGKKKL